MPFPTPTCRSRNLTFIAAFVLFSLLFNYYHIFSSTSSLAITPHFLTTLTTSISIPHKLPTSISDFTIWTSKPTSKFWHDFAPVLHATRPTCPPPTLLQKSPTTPFHPNAPYEPVNRLEMSHEDVASMTASHASFVHHITTSPPALDYTPSTQGIVTTAGGPYFPVLLTSLVMLRRTGCTLPIEVFLHDDSEYEPLLCETTLPKLGAKCIILSHLLSSSKHKFNVQGYQLKVLSILFSSFEDVLFLDADNFPASTDPAYLFSSPVYQSHGMILWKDFWAPSFSPFFPLIANLPSSDLAGKQTVEAGQIVVSKSGVGSVLMMSAYYNVFGMWFYGLIGQGGPGEGDKDTFLGAAMVLGKEIGKVEGDGDRDGVYVVERGPGRLGEAGNGAAVLQFDAGGDWACESARRKKSDREQVEKGGFVEGGIEGEGKEEVCDVAPLFIHASWPPKLNALHNVRSQRQWGSEENARSLFGYDVEKVAWGVMVEMACEGEVIHLSTNEQDTENANTEREGGEEIKRGEIEEFVGIGMGLGKLEFMDWGEGNKSSTGVCAQTRRCFGDMFGEEYKFGRAEKGKGRDDGRMSSERSRSRDRKAGFER